MFNKLLIWLGIKEEIPKPEPSIVQINVSENINKDELFGIPLEALEYIDSYHTAETILGKSMDVEIHDMSVGHTKQYCTLLEYYRIRDGDREGVIGKTIIYFKHDKLAYCYVVSESKLFNYKEVAEAINTSPMRAKVETLAKGHYKFVIKAMNLQQMSDAVTIFDKYFH